MQGQRNNIGSSTESGDFNQGRVANNAGSSRQASSSNVLSPLERVSSSMASPSESSYANASGHDVRNSTSCHYGEPSSRMNLQNQMNDDGIRTEHSWMSLNSTFVGTGLILEERRFATTSGHYSGRINNIGSSSHQVTRRPLLSEGSSVYHSPTYVSPNAGSLSSSSSAGHGVGSGVSSNIYRSGGLERDQTTSNTAVGTSSASTDYISGNDGGPASLSSNWGSSRKRMAFEGTSGQSYRGGNSNCFPQSENDIWHTTPAQYSSSGGLNLSNPSQNPPSGSHLEQHNPRFGSGNRGVPANANHSLGGGSSAESIQRNSGRRINLGWQQEYVPLNLSSTRNTRLSSVYLPNQLPIQGSYRESLGQRPSAAVAAAASSSNVHQRQAPSMHISGRSRTVHPWQIDPNLRVRNSSSCAIAGDRGTALQGEANIRSMPRTSTDHLMFGPVGELRNWTPDATNWNLDSRNVNNSGGFASSPIVPPSNAWSSPSRPLLHSPRRLPEIAPRSLLPPPPPDSNPGDHVSAFLSTASNAGDIPSDTAARSRVNSQSRHQAHQRPVLLERHNNDLFSAARALRILAADADDRRQLISEIRQVLRAVRRGENVPSEAVLLHPWIFHGMAGIRDRHGDMRLDIDNMSYEELLELGERIGDVSTGLDERTILNRMKQQKYHLTHMKPQEDVEPCCVCQEGYADGDDIGTLDCGHDFHTNCIKQWLKQKNLCPICKTTALAKEKD